MTARYFQRLVLLSILGLAGPALAGQMDPHDPDNFLTIARKQHCSTIDGEAITYWWHGRAYSRRQGERDKLLFLVEGMNVRQCTAVEDEKRGKGYKDHCDSCLNRF